MLGTTAKAVRDPERVRVDREEVKVIIDEASEMIPAVREVGVSKTYASVRPVIIKHRGKSAREAGREFQVYDHEELGGPAGVVSIVGGKATTARLMAERACNVISRRLGSKKPCSTHKIKLLDPARELFNDPEAFSKEAGVPTRLVKEALDRAKGIDWVFSKHILDFLALSWVVRRVGVKARGLS